MGFKMMPGSRDHGLKTGQGMAERGLISGGPKAYPLANNDPKSKPIEAWEVDVDLGDGTLDRQTAHTDVAQDPFDVVSKEEAKNVLDHGGSNPAPVSDYKPEAEIGRFSKALMKANTSPEGGLTRDYTRRDNFISDRGGTLSLMGGASTVEGNNYRRNPYSDNDYYKGLEDTPVSAMMGRTGIMDSQRSNQMNQLTGNLDGMRGINRLQPTDPAYNSNSSSMFSINKNRNTSRVATANIKSAEEVASDLKKRGTLDPTYLDKLDAYKKNKETKGRIY